jgi:hypothetical protein
MLHHQNTVNQNDVDMSYTANSSDAGTLSHIFKIDLTNKLINMTTSYIYMAVNFSHLTNSTQELHFLIVLCWTQTPFCLPFCKLLSLKVRRNICRDTTTDIIMVYCQLFRRKKSVTVDFSEASACTSPRLCEGHENCLQFPPQKINAFGK